MVVNSGGFDEVTKNRGWKQVGDIFQFPSTCTNSAYILKGVYIRNLVCVCVCLSDCDWDLTSLLIVGLGGRKVMEQGLGSSKGIARTSCS